MHYDGTKSGLCFRRKTQVVFHFEQKECRAWKIEHFCVKITRGEVGYYCRDSSRDFTLLVLHH